MCGIRFRFAKRMRVEGARLDGLDFFRAYILRLHICFAGVNLFVFFTAVFGFGFFLFFYFILFKNGAAHESVGGSVRLRLFVLGFYQAGRDYRDVFLANIFLDERRFRLMGYLLDHPRSSSKCLRRGDGVIGGGGQFFRPS